MQSTTLSFNNIHNHGDLFTNLLRARRESFIVERNWDLPETDGMEFDQYDTPESRWIAIHDGGQILGGFRLTPTTAKCGMYSYMIRDAQRGLLDTIPQNILYKEAPIAPHVFEFSRFFKASHLSGRARSTVQIQLLKALMGTRDTLGVHAALGIGSPNWERWMKRINLPIEHLGPIVDIEGSKNRCMITHLPGSYH
ncbi:N-acyl-L-homoserine lactone synthetase [Amylibacter marinus]|uniref:N-acyl-L-homoserine lactone synthetase n=1 Tax=Amylibacter marinus TaxID=1475483 RepID=A0ABQ5VV42_9RHOB|nr:acyl-homoserine-lactone synthase [Amylibacter marinus]GLQ35122.1 N-acyl-L-homoserine lactone synthetase [Amylibacter marinus]